MLPALTAGHKLFRMIQSVVYIRLNRTQLALVVLCFRNIRLQSCVMKQTTV